MGSPRPIPRVVATGRPQTDPACAGCPQLVLLRALRRAGVETTGALGCEPGDATFTVGIGRRAALASAGRLRALGPEGLVDDASAAGASLVVVADRAAHLRATSVEEALSGAGRQVARIDPSDPRGAEALVRAALEAPGSVLVSIFPCVHGLPRLLPLAADPARCNRCGSCLSLGCPALSDTGGEAVEVDAATCTGCGRCASLCRSRALRPVPG